MRRTPKLLARASVAVMAVTAVCLIASPASAHTNNLYTYLAADRSVVQSFATISRTDAATTALPTSASTIAEDIVGIEVFNEIGTAIIERDGGEGDDVYEVVAWDHTTGAESVPAPLLIDGVPVDFAAGLDTLANGATITYVHYEALVDEVFVRRAAIVSVSVSGALTVLIDLTALRGSGFVVNSLATDPVSGITYAFGEVDSSATTLVATLNFVVPGSGVPEPFTDVSFASGRVLGTDFDFDGTLYLIYSDTSIEGGPYQLSRVAPTSNLITASRVVVGAVNQDSVKARALTIEYTAPVVPQLAATGTDISSAWLTLGAVAVLAGVLTVVTTRRRQSRYGSLARSNS